MRRRCVSRLERPRSTRHYGSERHSPPEHGKRKLVFKKLRKIMFKMTEGARPELLAVWQCEEALPLALPGIFWTRKLAMIGFRHGTAWEGDDRQGNAPPQRCGGVFSKPGSDRFSIIPSGTCKVLIGKPRQIIPKVANFEPLPLSNKRETSFLPSSSRSTTRPPPSFWRLSRWTTICGTE